MSYGHNAGKPRWPSDYTYTALYNALSAAGTTASPATVPQAWTQADESLLVTGAITPTAGTAEFSVSYRLPQGIIAGQDLARAAAGLSSSQEPVYHLRLFNSVGNLLADQPFPLPEISDDIGPTRPFQVILPYAPGRDTHRRGPGRRRVGFAPDLDPSAGRARTGAQRRRNDADTLAVRWEGADEDGDAVLYTVQYSGTRAPPGKPWSRTIPRPP